MSARLDKLNWVTISCIKRLQDNMTVLQKVISCQYTVEDYAKVLGISRGMASNYVNVYKKENLISMDIYISFISIYKTIAIEDEKFGKIARCLLEYDDKEKKEIKRVTGIDVNDPLDISGLILYNLKVRNFQ